MPYSGFQSNGFQSTGFQIARSGASPIPTDTHDYADYVKKLKRQANFAAERRAAEFKNELPVPVADVIPEENQEQIETRRPILHLKKNPVFIPGMTIEPVDLSAYYDELEEEVIELLLLH